MADLTFDQLFDKLSKHLDRVDKRSRQAAKASTSLAESLGELSGAAMVSNTNINNLVKQGRRMVAGATALTAAATALADEHDKYQTASRRAIRGTSLMRTGVSDLTASYLTAQRHGRLFAMEVGSSAEEGVAAAAALQDAYTKSGRSLIEGAEGVSKVLGVSGRAMRMTGLDVQDMTALYRTSVQDLGFSTQDTIGLLGDLSAATEVFGVNGKRAMEMVTEALPRLQAMDVKERRRYLQSLIRTAGIQERASVEFGKYTMALTSAQGKDAIMRGEVLAAFSGRKASDLDAAMLSPQSPESQKMLIEAVRQAAETIAPGYIEAWKRAQGGPEALAAAERESPGFMRQLRISQEKLTASLGDLGVLESLEGLPESMAALQRVNQRMVAGGSDQRAFAARASDVLERSAVALEKLKTQDERLNSIVARNAVGAGSDAMDKFLDVYGKVTNEIRATGGKLAILGSAAWTLARVFKLMAVDAGLAMLRNRGRGGGGGGGFPWFGKNRGGGPPTPPRVPVTPPPIPTVVTNGVGTGGRSVIPWIGGLTGRAGALGRGLGRAASVGARSIAPIMIAIDAVETLSKMVNSDGRMQMRGEIEDAVKNLERSGFSGAFGNFVTDFLHPVNAVGKLAIEINDAVSAMEDLDRMRASRDKAQKDWERVRKLQEANHDKLLNSKRLLEMVQKGDQKSIDAYVGKASQRGADSFLQEDKLGLVKYLLGSGAPDAVDKYYRWDEFRKDKIRLSEDEFARMSGERRKGGFSLFDNNAPALAAYLAKSEKAGISEPEMFKAVRQMNEQAAADPEVRNRLLKMVSRLTTEYWDVQAGKMAELAPLRDLAPQAVIQHPTPNVPPVTVEDTQPQPTSEAPSPAVSILDVQRILNMMGQITDSLSVLQAQGGAPKVHLH